MFVYAIVASLCLCHLSKIAAQQRSLYRNPNGDFNFINLRELKHQYLWADKVTSSMVLDERECAFLCVAEPNCNSINVAASPDVKDLHMCELLATDKYRAPERLRANSTFNHYSPWSPCESDPCKNGADCVPDYQLNSYHCDCGAGFIGTHCERECDMALGLESLEIPDSAITASSFYMDELVPSRVRLNSPSAWSVSINGAGEWIQVDLGRRSAVQKVATQGRNIVSHYQWVTLYKVASSNDGVNWETYQENGTEKEFRGNSDRYTVVSHVLEQHIVTRYVRILPLTWHERISLRAELYGCSLD